MGDYETEQLCAKLTLGELQSLCASLAADGVDREQMVVLLQVQPGSSGSQLLSSHGCWLAYSFAVMVQGVLVKAHAKSCCVALAAAFCPSTELGFHAECSLPQAGFHGMSAGAKHLKLWHPCRMRRR